MKKRKVWKGTKKICEKCKKEFVIEFEHDYYKICSSCYVEGHKEDTMRAYGSWKNLRVCTHVHEGPRKEFVWKRREA